MFPPPTGGGGNVSSSDPQRHQWAAAPNGDRFLVRVPPQLAPTTGRGTTQVAPTAQINATTADPTQFAVSAAGRGRGRNLQAPALTVILDWAGAQGKER
jgi:hypothetical protein